MTGYPGTGKRKGYAMNINGEDIIGLEIKVYKDRVKHKNVNNTY